MNAPLTPLKSQRRAHWSTILGILLVPLTVAGVLLWGLWNPTERLENVTAAVVNLDEAVELDGQMVPLGRVLAGELIGDEAEGGGQNFTWVLTDADDAQAGVDDGRYATVVTIPKSFSTDATSLSGDPQDARQARIEITESDRGRLIDTALSSIVTQTATRVLNQQLGEQFVDGVYVGFNELGDGVGEAAEGAAQLATGGRQLEQGAAELAGGTQQLADGTTQLASGATQLADGTGALVGGTTQLADGAGGLAGGAAQLSHGAGSLSQGVSAYTAGAAQLAESYAPLASGAQGAVAQLRGLVVALGELQLSSAVPQQQLQDGLAAAGAGAQQLGVDTAALAEECAASGADAAFCERMVGTLQTRAGEIGSGVGLASEGATGLGDAMAELQEAAGAGAGNGGAGAGDGDPLALLDQLSAGLDQFGAGLDGFAGQGAQLSAGAAELATGAAGLSDGAAGLAGGATDLAAGTTQLSSGASELAAGTTQLAEQTPQLADGAGQLADGAAQAAAGAGELASGLDSAAQSVPTTSDAERDQLARSAATPVLAEGGSDELFNSSGVPLFAGIALWAGALAVFLTFAPLWRRTREAARGVGFIAIRSALPALGIGAAQGALAGIVLPVALGYDFEQGARFFGFALLAGVAFALVVQGLSALFGGLGRFIAFALLVVAFAVGIVSTVPGALAAVGDFSPLGAASAGFQAIATGASSAAGSAVALALWAAAGLVLTTLAVARGRRARALEAGAVVQASA